MAEEIEFENRHFATLSLMTLTLTSDDLESHIIVNISSTLINTTICFVAALFFIVDVQFSLAATSGTSALEVFLYEMRCINVRFTYLLTYLRTYV